MPCHKVATGLSDTCKRLEALSIAQNLRSWAKTQEAIEDLMRLRHRREDFIVANAAGRLQAQAQDSLTTMLCLYRRCVSASGRHRVVTEAVLVEAASKPAAAHANHALVHTPACSLSLM